MRLTVEKIKQSILHTDEEVRLTAVSYFADSFSLDPTAMPLVVQAVEKFGRDSSFSILRKGEHLVQSAPTLEWLINQLRQTYNIDDINDDNVRFAIALVILAAPIDLLKSRKAEIDGLANFSDSLRGFLDQRLQMMTWGLEQCWEALEVLGRNTMKRGESTLCESRYASQIIESVPNYLDEAGDLVLALLRKDCPGKDSHLMTWLEPEVVELAGKMRLGAAVPILVRHLHSDDLLLADAAATALSRIGTDAVVETIAGDWREGSDDFRGGAADVLEKIHTDLSVGKCLALLDEEEDMDTALILGHALLSHFSFDGIEPVRELVLEVGDDLSSDHFDLRYHLVAATTIMGAKFPEYEDWYEEALETNWGWEDYEHAWLADAFQPDPVGPMPSENGHG